MTVQQAIVSILTVPLVQFLWKLVYETLISPRDRMVNVFQFQTSSLSNSWLLKSAEIYWTPTTNIGDLSILETKNSLSFFERHFSPCFMRIGHFWRKKYFEFSKFFLSLEKKCKWKIFKFFLKTTFLRVLSYSDHF